MVYSHPFCSSVSLPEQWHIHQVLNRIKEKVLVERLELHFFQKRCSSFIYKQKVKSGNKVETKINREDGAGCSDKKTSNWIIFTEPGVIYCCTKWGIWTMKGFAFLKAIHITHCLSYQNFTLRSSYSDFGQTLRVWELEVYFNSHNHSSSIFQ